MFSNGDNEWDFGLYSLLYGIAALVRGYKDRGSIRLQLLLGLL